MGRFSPVLLLLFTACTDHLLVDDNEPLTDELTAVGGAIEQSGVPRNVPSVCGVQTWRFQSPVDAGMNVSVARRAHGAVALATPRSGGVMTGFELDTQMNMVAQGKVAPDVEPTRVVASSVGSHLASTAIQGDVVHVHLLDDGLANAKYVAKLVGTSVAEPAFYTLDGRLVMPAIADDGLWLHQLSDSFEPLASTRVASSQPARSLAAAQLGSSLLTAWSTDDACHMMLSSGVSSAIDTRVPSACHEPRMAVNPSTNEGVMVFDSAAGVRLMNVSATQLSGDSSVVCPETYAPRTLFDGTNFWVSYLNARGDVVVGVLGANRKVVTIALADAHPEPGAYELALVGGAPWVVALNSEGYTAHRMCVDTVWE
ncbi:MAG TPA: hypothetical protein VIV11_04690 [Kofleriaceae bacterium]